jgi:putative PEP-CTERM system TPR-repeat lipoprotein
LSQTLSAWRWLLFSTVVVLSLTLIGCNRGPSEAELLTSAKGLIAKKDFKGAIIQLKSTLQKNATSAEARLLLGQQLLASGDPVAAQVELLKAQELQVPDDQVVPDLARAMLQLGQEAKVITQYGALQLKTPAAAADLQTSLATSYAVQNDRERADRAVATALAAVPDYAAALIVQARLKIVSGDVDGGLALLDGVLQRDGADENAGLLKGEVLRQIKRDVTGAVDAYRKVMVSHPSSVPAQAALLGLLLEQGKLPEVRTQFAALKKAAPDNSETLYFEARLAFIDKDFKASREITERLLKVMPENVRVLLLAGAAEFRMKQYLQAESLLAHALKNAPRQLLARQLLAQTFLRSSQPDKAVEVLKPVVEGEGADGASLAIAGEAYLQLGDTQKSEASFQRALKVAPGDTTVRTAAAVAQMARGNTGAAAAELEAIAGGEGDSRADLALVTARLRQNDTAGALKAIDGLARKLPDQAMPLNMRGRVQLLANDSAGARLSFEAALAKDPDYFASVASLAAIELAEGKPDAARKRFEDYRKRQPRSWQAALALAELGARTGAPTATVTAQMRDAAKLNPAEPRPHLLLIERLLGSADPKSALPAAEEAAASLPNNLEIQAALGQAQLAAGDLQRAISTFKKLASLQPRNATHELRMADALMANNEPDEAAAALKRALVLQPNYVPARRGLALIALNQQRPHDATAIARDLQQRHAADPAGYVLEGDVEASQKNWAAALTAYRAALVRGKSAAQAIKVHTAMLAAGKKAEADTFAADWTRQSPQDAAFAYYLGDRALSANDLPLAEAKYREVLKVQPNNALALNNVAWLLVKQGKPGALPLAEKATQVLPDRAQLLDTLASAQEAESQLPKAVETQLRAVALAPGDGMLSLRLAQLYIKQGDKPKARAALEELAKRGDKFPAQAEVGTLLKSL